MDILQALSFNAERSSTLVLSNSDRQQTIAIGLMPGQTLKKHISATPAMIVVLKGSILFDMEGSVEEIKELNSFNVPFGVPHEVTGLEKSVFLLIKDKV